MLKAAPARGNTGGSHSIKPDQQHRWYPWVKGSETYRWFQDGVTPQVRIQHIIRTEGGKDVATGNPADKAFPLHYDGRPIFPKEVCGAKSRRYAVVGTTKPVVGVRGRLGARRVDAFRRMSSTHCAASTQSSGW